MPRPRQPKPTPDLLTQLPFSVTSPTFWDTISFPGDAWLVDRMAQMPDPYRFIPQDLIAREKEDAAAMDWRAESGERIVYTVATAEALHRAIRRFGPAPLPADGPQDEYDMRVDYYLLRLTEPGVVPDVCLPAIAEADAAEPGAPMFALLSQLVYVLHAYAGATAEFARRRSERPEVLAAWTVLALRHPEHAKLAAETNETAQRAAFGDLFAGRGEEGRSLLGRMFRRHVAALHGVPRTREALEGLLWSEFLLTLLKEWDHASLSDFGVIAAALDGDLKRLHWDVYNDLVDVVRREEKRPAVEAWAGARRRLPKPVEPAPVDCPRCGRPGDVLPPYVCPECGLGVPRGT